MGKKIDTLIGLSGPVLAVSLLLVPAVIYVACVFYGGR
jgi:hypothetical protein